MGVEAWSHKGGTILLHLYDGWSGEMEQAVRAASFDGLRLGPGMGSFRGLDAVAEKVRWLHSPGIDSWEGLEMLSQVERITNLQEVPQPPFDFRKLPKLRLLDCGAACLLHAPFLNHPALEVLRLQESEVKDMTFLSDARSLRALQMKYSQLKTLAGLENCGRLSELHVSDSRSLTDISAVAGLRDLEIVEFSDTPNIADISPLYELKNMRCLIVSSNKAKPRDLEWLRGMERLECAGIWVESSGVDWRVFAEHPRLYDVSFYTTKDFQAGSDEEILAQLQSAGRTVKKLTRYPKDKFPGFRIEFVPPPDILNPVPTHWYQMIVRYEAKF